MQRIVKLALLCSLDQHSLFAQSDIGTLRVTIHDKASGQVVPAMVCITSLADKTWRIPPDGRFPAGFVTNQEFIAGRWKSLEYIAGDKKKWFPGDVGPPILMNPDARHPGAWVPRYCGRRTSSITTSATFRWKDFPAGSNWETSG